MQNINTTTATVNNINIKFVIGKAKVMYTLYKVITQGNRSIASFVQILSKDLNKVKSMYPGLEVDETLHGKIVERIISNVNADSSEPSENTKKLGFKFKAGKYAGYLVEEVNDLGYLCFCYNNNYFSNISLAIKARAIELGAIEIYDKIYEEGSKGIEIMNRVQDFIETGKSFGLTIKGHVDCNATYTDNDSKFEFIFNNVKWSKSGYYYSLPYPIDMYGKAKRVNGKHILIKKGYIEKHEDNSNLFVIEEFEVVKL